MSDDKNTQALYEAGRRKNLRSEATDRRENIRPTKRLKLLFFLVAAVVIVVIFLTIFLINPKI